MFRDVSGDWNSIRRYAESQQLEKEREKCDSRYWEHRRRESNSAHCKHLHWVTAGLSIKMNPSCSLARMKRKQFLRHSNSSEKRFLLSVRRNYVNHTSFDPFAIFDFSQKRMSLIGFELQGAILKIACLQIYELFFCNNKKKHGFSSHLIFLQTVYLAFLRITKIERIRFRLTV